jgi:hypothetical protein
MRRVEPFQGQISALDDGRIITHNPFKDTIYCKGMSAPSLGPNGLQILLLADEGLECIQDESKIGGVMMVPYMICFDLVYLGPATEVTPCYRSFWI